VALFAFIKFTANHCSKSDFQEENINARKSVATKTSSAVPCATTGTVAAQSAASAAGGEVTNLFRAGKQKAQRRFNPRCPGRFAVIGALDFEVS
jgi:hypothetical protein